MFYINTVYRSYLVVFNNIISYFNKKLIDGGPRKLFAPRAPEYINTVLMLHNMYHYYRYVNMLFQ